MSLICTVDEMQNERRRTVEILANHLANKKSKTIPCKEELICEFTSLLIKNESRRANSILQGTKVTTNDKTVGIGSQTSFCCAHGHNFQLSPNLTHPDSKGLTFMDYEANVKAVIQGYMNGQAGNSLDTTGVMMDLPKAQNFT